MSAELANYDLIVGRTTAVGSYPKGATPEDGICDLAGNVWEWCSDWYDEDYYELCEQQSVVTNPQGPLQGSSRVLRGGSWGYNAQLCRSAFRIHIYPDLRINNFGFRVVFVP